MGGKVLKALKNANSSMLTLDYWRSFFKCAGTDIFDLIDHAMLVATEDFPDEFLTHRDQIIKTFFADPQNKIKDESKSVEEVKSIKETLANWEEKSEYILLQLLKYLQTMELSEEILKVTKIMKTVRCLQKHHSKQIKHLAKLLIYSWKLLKDERVDTNQNSEESFNNVHAIKDVPSSQDVTLTLPSLVSWEEEEFSKKLDDLPFEAKLENTRKRLQKAYREENNAKKQRCVKLIDLKDLPQQDKLQDQRKLNSRCCPKKLSNLHINYAYRLGH